METPRIDLQYVLDRTAIEAVITRYFQGLDRGLRDQVRSCFTDDVKAYYDGRDPISGIEDMMRSLNTFKRLAAGTMKATTHFMGNLSIHRLQGDMAETETYAIAFLVHPNDPAGPVAMRSLRYLDRLRKAQGEWRISERRHTLDWSSELKADFAVALAQRITTWP
jgi:ketosteroid isomerase-like protein